MAILKIVREKHPSSPREWDNLGVMACWHPRYDLGDVQPKKSPNEWMAENVPEGSVVLPLYLYDHSGISMSTGREYPFNCQWDSMQVGWIVCASDRIRKEYGAEEITAEIREKVEKVLQAEVGTYDDYLRGEVYGYVVLDKHGETLDSCWDFIGGDIEACGLADNIPTEHLPYLQEAWDGRN